MDQEDLVGLVVYQVYTGLSNASDIVHAGFAVTNILVLQLSAGEGVEVNPVDIGLDQLHAVVVDFMQELLDLREYLIDNHLIHLVGERHRPDDPVQKVQNKKHDVMLNQRTVI